MQRITSFSSSNRITISTNPTTNQKRKSSGSLRTTYYARSDRTIFIRIARPLTFYRKSPNLKKSKTRTDDDLLFQHRWKERRSSLSFFFVSFYRNEPTNRENSASTGSIIAKVVLIYCCALIRAEIVSPNGTWNGKLKNTFSFFGKRRKCHWSR